MTVLRASLRLVLIGLMLGLVACGSLPKAWSLSSPPRGWVTTADGAQRMAPMMVGAWRPADSATPTINVNPARTYQVMAGFGASITDSSAWLIQNRMSPRQRAALLRELFGRNPGLGLSATRLTIGASDFSISHYSYRESEAAEFSLSPAEADVVPTVRAAARLNPDMTIIASPWSAPGWMKTGGSLVQGSLAPDHYDDFARYLMDYVTRMGVLGIHIDALTIQNEPHFEPDSYPGMRMTPAERAAFVGKHLGPLIEREGGDVDILEWDHNWDEPEAPLAVLADAVAARYIEGVAWHCYGGDVSAQSRVQAAHPDKSVWLTECSGGGWEPGWDKALTSMTRALIIGAPRNWARGVLLWNLALDETSGPHAGGCGNCRGVVTINWTTGEVTRNVEYYVLAHASRFVRPGALRIDSDTGVAGLESVAFRNIDDGSIVLIVLNGGAAVRGFQIVVGSRAFGAELPPGAVATYVWQGSRQER